MGANVAIAGTNNFVMFQWVGLNMACFLKCQMPEKYIFPISYFLSMRFRNAKMDFNAESSAYQENLFAMVNPIV